MACLRPLSVFEAAPLWLRSCRSRGLRALRRFGADANSAWLCSKEPFAIDDGLL
jgi:hypothetical protein